MPNSPEIVSPETASDAVVSSDDPSERSADVFVDDHAGLGQRCLRAARAFAAGDVIVPFRARRTLDRPSRMTVQVSEHEHILLAPTLLENVNHGCEPNVAFDTVRRGLVALVDITPGDELVFFYPSTEWRMASVFACACGAPSCLGWITGAARMPRRVLARHAIAPHIVRLLDVEDRTEHALEMGIFYPIGSVLAAT